MDLLGQHEGKNWNIEFKSVLQSTWYPLAYRKGKTSSIWPWEMPAEFDFDHHSLDLVG